MKEIIAVHKKKTYAHNRRSHSYEEYSDVVIVNKGNLPFLSYLFMAGKHTWGGICKYYEVVFVMQVCAGKWIEWHIRSRLEFVSNIIRHFDSEWFSLVLFFE